MTLEPLGFNGVSVTSGPAGRTPAIMWAVASGTPMFTQRRMVKGCINCVRSLSSAAPASRLPKRNRLNEVNSQKQQLYLLHAGQ
eukprot:4900311-Amphidinium_carterae.1